MSETKMIVFAGLPLTGKSTLAKLLEDRLKIARLDVDEIRQMLFKYHPVDSETDRVADAAQMQASWKSLYALAENVLDAGDPVIVVGTFSREIQHQRIREIAEMHDTLPRVIFCHAPDEIIMERMGLRKQDKENLSNLMNMEGYSRVRERYVKIYSWYLLDLDTSEPIEKCLAKVMKFVNQEASP